jgi:hypothetical protein
MHSGGAAGDTAGRCLPARLAPGRSSTAGAAAARPPPRRDALVPLPGCCCLLALLLLLLPPRPSLTCPPRPISAQRFRSAATARMMREVAFSNKRSPGGGGSSFLHLDIITIHGWRGRGQRSHTASLGGGTNEKTFFLPPQFRPRLCGGPAFTLHAATHHAPGAAAATTTARRHALAAPPAACRVDANSNPIALLHSAARQQQQEGCQHLLQAPCHPAGTARRRCDCGDTQRASAGGRCTGPTRA